MTAKMAGLTGLAIAAGLLVSATAAGEVLVSTVRAQQLADGTKRVEVLYDLTGAPAVGATVSVAFSATGDALYSIVPAAPALSGDVGAGIASGSNKRIPWDCKQTLPAESYGTTYRAAVTAVDPGGGGQQITIYLGAGKGDYRSLLRQEDWPLFNALRDWRSGRARAEGVPTYIIVTNDLLARVARERPASLSALGQIRGMGEAKIKRHGPDILTILGRHAPPPAGSSASSAQAGAPAPQAEQQEVGRASSPAHEDAPPSPPEGDSHAAD